MSFPGFRKALAASARAWRDPEHPRRSQAVDRTLAEGRGNRFTAEAVAFAINQQMGQVNVAALDRWLGQPCQTPSTVAILEAGNVPMAGLQDYLAVVGMGHAVLASVSSKSPFLLPAFAAEVAERGGPVMETGSFRSLMAPRGEADAVIASGSDETVIELEVACDAAGISESRRLLRGTRIGVAVLDGREHEEQRVRLAEDVLLHEGLGCRNVALIFAPDDLDADPYFEAFSVFRGTFPAHAATSGGLKMQQAFLAAVKSPHAFGEGLAWLVSRGEAEVQAPGHVRWVPYGSLEEVTGWLEAHAHELQVLAARPKVMESLPDVVERVTLGNTQRPSLNWRPDGIDTVRFLRDLG